MSIVDHIAIRVDDLEQSEKWYCEKLTAEVVFRDSKYIRLKVENTYIALISKKHYPWPHIGIIVEDKDSLPTTEDGASVVHHRDGTIGAYLKDPSGNYIEYIWYSDECKDRLM